MIKYCSVLDENRGLIKTSMNQFRQSLILALKQIAKVTIIRITRVEVILILFLVNRFLLFFLIIIIYKGD